jgi:hypothetical protein
MSKCYFYLSIQAVTVFLSTVCLIWQPPRTRYCRKCNAYTDHFDHHCPAIKNCVGKPWVTLVKVIEIYNVVAFKASNFQLICMRTSFEVRFPFRRDGVAANTRINLKEQSRNPKYFSF